jgi:prolyl 4-hydroxylase
MKAQCAPVCFSCEYLTWDGRCPKLPNVWAQQNVWGPGDLHAMFERIVERANPSTTTLTTIPNTTVHLSTDPLPFPLQILSRPSQATTSLEDDDAPWVLALDDFLTLQECEALIQLGSQRGYEPSKGLDRKPLANGTYTSSVFDGRTSSNTWCLDDCFRNATTQQILSRIESLTGIPDTNAEYLQLLHYEEGQYYRTHSDFIEFHLERAQGVRVVTVFLYLNDLDEGTTLPSGRM